MRPPNEGQTLEIRLLSPLLTQVAALKRSLEGFAGLTFARHRWQWKLSPSWAGIIEDQAGDFKQTACVIAHHAPFSLGSLLLVFISNRMGKNCLVKFAFSEPFPSDFQPVSTPL